MSEQRIIMHKAIMMGAVMLSVVALPFSVKITHGAIIAVLINWAAEGKWRTKLFTLRNSLLLQLLIMMFALQVIGLAFSDQLVSGWFSLEKKVFFLLLPVALATTAIKLDQKEVKWIFTSFVTACLAGTIICLVNAWHEAQFIMAGNTAINPYFSAPLYFELHEGASTNWLLFSYLGLSKGIGIHPTYFSLFLAFCVIFLLTEFPLIRSRIKKTGVLMLLLYFVAFIMFLSSRIVILGLAVIFIFILVKSVRERQRTFAVIAVAITFVFASLMYVNPVTRYRNLQEIDTTTFEIKPGHHYTNAARIRTSLWWLALKSLSHANPLVGAGTGDVQHVMSNTSHVFRISNVIDSSDPHNEYLYTLLANGIPALLVLIFNLLLPACWAWAAKDFLVLGFIFLISLAGMTESVLELQKGIVFYAVVSGLLFYHTHSFQTISINFRALRVGQ